MNKINVIQNAIKELEGGSFQKLFDAYLYKKYQFNNIQTLGVQEGTNKTTLGTPDSFVLTKNKKYILIMYGTVQNDGFQKIKKDILSCFEKDKLKLEGEKIEKIICAYSSTNLHVEQIEALRNLVPGIEIEIIGLSTISHDLLIKYPFLAFEYLNIPIDTHQIFAIEDFIKIYDKNGISAPLDMKFFYRDKEKEKLYSAINSERITLVTGASGVGKTRLILEVCKKLENEGWNVLCIKNNGETLCNDLKYYISDEGKYILFVDDANQTTSMKFILDYITEQSDKMIIKLVMSVRDYAKERVCRLACEYYLPVDVQIDVLEKEEIKEILKNNLEIKNEYILENIAEFSRGNVRLAILAGKLSFDTNKKISDKIDVFRHYYGGILHDLNLKEEVILALFLVVFLGPIRFKENRDLEKILELVGINKERFVKICYALYDRELIDLYENEAVKVSDQSFGDYILEYVLIEKKMIAIKDLLKIVFPKYKNKIIWTINTLIYVFPSEELLGYVQAQVNTAWELEESYLQDEYLKTFYLFNEEKTLFIIKKKIDAMPEARIEILSENIKENESTIKIYEIDILSKLKKSECYEDAVRLMLIFYKKRPDLVMDFYNAFSENMLVDENSHIDDYEREFVLANCLWEYADNGRDNNVTVLLLYIFKKLLQCTLYKTRLGRSHDTITMFTFQLFFTDGMKKLRSFIWEKLSVLYVKKKYRDFICKIIISRNVGYRKEFDFEQIKHICEYDLECIKKLFFDPWEKLSFKQCLLLKNLEEQSKWMKIETEQFFKRLNENLDFVIYNALIKKEIGEKNWDINSYDYLFQLCKVWEHMEDIEKRKITTGLDHVFLVLENQPKVYYKVIERFLSYEAPFCKEGEKQIQILMQNFGVNKTKALIEKYDFKYKQLWIKSFWELLQEEMITMEHSKGLLEFVRAQAVTKTPVFPKAIYLEKYKRQEPEIVEVVSKIVIDSCKKNRYLSEQFLSEFMKEEAWNKLFDVFSGTENLLEDLYILVKDINFDCEGLLAIKLVRRNLSFWNRYTLKLNDDYSREYFAYNIFEKVWRMDNYRELITIAYNNMLEDDIHFITRNKISMIFSNGEKTPEMIRGRKKQWIEEYIHNNFENIEKMYKIFNVVAAVFPSQRIRFLQVLTKYTKDIGLLKRVPLFYYPEVVVGRKILSVDRKIEFLNNLILIFKGIDFIEYRYYLEKMKNNLDEQRKELLIQEYLENNDIA